MNKLVHFGAGNIGRSFIGQIFSSAGYEIVFIDINQRVVDALNTDKQYRVIIKSTDWDSEIPVSNVRAVNAAETEKVIREIETATLVSTSVGKNALRFIFSSLANGINARWLSRPDEPLDIIIAENIRDGGAYFMKNLAPLLSEGIEFDSYVGLVETSIGKMVPIMPAEITEKDPLLVFAEPYNTLILDKDGFRGSVPSIRNIKAVSPVKAYVDRKLFIHNLGHTAAAYLGNKPDRNLKYIWEALEIESAEKSVIRAMQQAGAAVRATYPDVFSEEDMNRHINDLVGRFKNRSLGDTIFRVGRDLKRKLGREDRIFGAIMLAESHELPWESIKEVYLAALHFDARDDTGTPFQPDLELRKKIKHHSLAEILDTVSDLGHSELENRVRKQFLK